MPIKLENVGIAVRDIDEAIAFFTDLGLNVIGRDAVSGEWADTAIGLDGNHAKIAMLATPQPTQPHEIGMHRVAFSDDDIDDALAIAARNGVYPLRGVANYQNIYKLSYLRGPAAFS